MEDKFKQLSVLIGQAVEKEDSSALYQFRIDHLWDLLYNQSMKKYFIHSKKHGSFQVLLDDRDFELMNSMGKWNINMLRGHPYIQKRVAKNKTIQLHRFLMQAKKNEYVDHINHDTLDNQRKNLRVCSNAANIRNGKLRSNNKSGYTGITMSSNNKYDARIRVNYKIIHLGRFTTKEEAIRIRKEAEEKYWNI